MERLQRYLSRAGVSSRRAAERIIQAGSVSVNGVTVTALGTKIDPAADRVTVDGRPVIPPPEFTYVILNKPAGYVTTMHDPHGRRRVVDLLDDDLPRIYPVGRLDVDTTGLLLLTNDGDLTHKLLHPSTGVWKTYHAVVEGVPSPQILVHLSRGVELDDGPTAPAMVKILRTQDGHATLEMKLHEGRKRQVRRMLAAVGHRVLALERVCFGPLGLNGLPRGSWRFLTKEEAAKLNKLASGRGSRGETRGPRVFFSCRA